MIDRQTLAWMKRDKYWMKILKPSFVPINYGGGIAENASLPSTLRPTFSTYIHPLTNEKQNIINASGVGDWGTEGWHHNSQLADNPCGCDRCKGIGRGWWLYPIDRLMSVEYESVFDYNMKNKKLAYWGN